MADNVTLDPGTGGADVATDQVTGTLEHIQLFKLAISADGSRTLIPADGTNGLSVDVTRVQGSVAVGSIAAGDNNIGNVDIASAIPAGTNNIGDVDVASIAAGDNNIGNVDIVTVPADPFGANADAAVAAGAAGSIQAKLRRLTTDLDAVKTSVQLLDDAIAGTEMQVDVVGSLPAGTNAIGKLAANSGVDIGDVDVTSIAAGTNAIGNVGLVPRTSGGLSVVQNLDIDETEDAIKASAGQLFGWYLYNDGATEVYVKFYDDTVANVTVGSTTPVMTLGIPAGSGANVLNGMGIAFANAITVAATTAAAVADTGAPAASQVVGTFFYA